MIFKKYLDKHPSTSLAASINGNFSDSNCLETYLKDAVLVKMPINAFHTAEEFVTKNNRINDEYDLEYVRLPFPNMFIDFGKFGYWICRNLKNEAFDGLDAEQISVLIINEDTNKANIESSLNVFTINRNANQLMLAVLCGESMILPKSTGGYKAPILDMRVISMLDDALDIGGVIDALTVIRILSIMNCKNIELVERRTPNRVIRKRRKKGKVPITSHYEIEIKQSIRRRNGGRDSSSQGLWNNRVHLCRGHLKKFTAERPLFGKNVGLYWWDAHVRGNKSEGEIHKDYRYVA